MRRLARNLRGKPLIRSAKGHSGAMEPKSLPLSNVIDLLLDAICVVDVEGRFLFVSAAFKRIFGYAAAEVLGRPMIELVYPPDRARTLRAASDIMAGQDQ